jgi:integrase
VSVRRTIPGRAPGPRGVLQRQAGHADPRTTTEYVEDAKRMEQSTSRELGL